MQEGEGTLDLMIAILAGQGTEVPFAVEYITIDGSAEGKQNGLVSKINIQREPTHWPYY